MTAPQGPGGDPCHRKRWVPQALRALEGDGTGGEFGIGEVVGPVDCKLFVAQHA